MTSPPIITELEIQGFKSFGVPGQKVRLGPLNFLVGANASGKTNFLTALRFLQCAVLNDLEYAINEYGGLAEVRNKVQRQRSQPKPLTIRFRLEMPAVVNLVGPGNPAPSTPVRFHSFDCAVKFDLRASAGKPLVVEEDVRAELELDGGRLREFHLNRSGDTVVISDPTDRLEDEPKERTYRVPDVESSRLAIGVGLFSLPCVLLREFIADWRFYNISPRVARQPYRETPDMDLGAAGEGLAVVLRQIEQQNGTGSLEPIVTGLQGVIPGFKGLKTTRLPVESKVAFQVLEEKIHGALNPESVSDGTIRLLALMVIAHGTPKPATLVALEEPENGVHPHLSEYIVQILRTASEHRQVIVTTHNPALLDFVEPGEVILCDKKAGFTQLRRACDVQQIEVFRREFSLGELWTQGALGGIP